jgi:SAM-dependent methyltransferase
MALPGSDLELDRGRRDAFAARLQSSLVGGLELLAIEFGLELGLYRALRNAEPATSTDLAPRAAIAERYAREWLEQQAISGVLEVDDPSTPAESRRYTLPAGHAEVLLDPDSLASAAALPRELVAAATAMPLLLDAYRTGAGVPWAAYPGIVSTQEASNRGIFRHLLVQTWLAAIPDIDARLRSGARARVADVACGAGWSSIALARGYPGIEVHGLDIDPESIERARANAAAEGIPEDRLRFHLVDAGRNDLDGTFDLVTIVEALHDMARPVEVLSSMLRLIAAGGTAIVIDEKAAERFAPPGDEAERLIYGYSLLFCLPNGLADPRSAGTGAVMRPATLRGYAEAAGFGRVTILPIEDELLRVYRLDP